MSNNICSSGLFIVLLVATIAGCSSAKDDEAGGDLPSSALTTEKAVTLTMALDSTSTSSSTGVSSQPWPRGTKTCEQLEDNIPNGVDDLSMSFEDGLLTYYGGDQNPGGMETIQVLDDSTCTMNTAAWEFLIRHSFNRAGLERRGTICAVLSTLERADFAPANAPTILLYLGQFGAIPPDC